MYFKEFPYIQYTTLINDEWVTTTVKDITINARVRRRILENINLFDDYYISNNETPDSIAAKYYGNSIYHWVVMLCNQKYHYLEDFPMDQVAFDKYLSEKYRSVDVPTFNSTDFRNIYISNYKIENVYDGNSSDAVMWEVNRYYPVGTLIKYNDFYYKVIGAGTSDTYPVDYQLGEAVPWEMDTFYTQGTIIVHSGRYYSVIQEGTTEGTAPTHTIGEFPNGDAILKTGLLLLEQVNVIDLDTSLHWPLFPSENEAVDFIDMVYTSYGRDIHSTTKVDYVHHFEDLNGNIINFLEPWTLGMPNPINAVTGDYYKTDEFGSVSNRQYEEQINESKRYIKLISKEMLNSIVDQLRSII